MWTSSGPKQGPKQGQNHTINKMISTNLQKHCTGKKPQQYNRNGSEQYPYSRFTQSTSQIAFSNMILRIVQRDRKDRAGFRYDQSGKQFLSSNHLYHHTFQFDFQQQVVVLSPLVLSRNTALKYHQSYFGPSRRTGRPRVRLSMMTWRVYFPSEFSMSTTFKHFKRKQTFLSLC